MRSRIAAVCAALNAAGARYLVAGGAACVLHGYVRATTDVDILIEPTEENAARILAALSTIGYGFARELAARDILTKPITVLGDDPAVDVFHGLWGVSYASAAPSRVVVDLEGVAVPVLALEDLIASKRSGRPLDQADVEALEHIQRLRQRMGAE
ncbi:MAG TPA: hypothetical protein VMM18_03060 [Gemmatimonadaceae bacterium]|nr:hypothetical protein [Gemmatimonadaceae bacterium]